MTTKKCVYIYVGTYFEASSTKRTEIFILWRRESTHQGALGSLLCILDMYASMQCMTISPLILLEYFKLYCNIYCGEEGPLIRMHYSAYYAYWNTGYVCKYAVRDNISITRRWWQDHAIGEHRQYNAHHEALCLRIEAALVERKSGNKIEEQIV